ncbi:hypothetical protein MUK42_16744 [Musa troglodytarum]|uniref:Uncharacterized protein n=1 Tax=Musa troglodytarum TaxID=320322 RepID=A0A9E7HSV3_9LILI|nr:hypothetical protein MUK42_16744 [Musa troglodytarum]
MMALLAFKGSLGFLLESRSVIMGSVRSESRRLISRNRDKRHDLLLVIEEVVNLRTQRTKQEHYVEIDDMVNMAMKIERQLKRKGTRKMRISFQEVPNGLPPIRGIEHQIDFIPVQAYQIGQHRCNLRDQGNPKAKSRHAKWVEFIESFPYIIKYKQGSNEMLHSFV